MKVICIYEDNHGLIGVAKDYTSAIEYLIEETDWLDENEITDEGLSVREKFGENWTEPIYNLEMCEFNDLFFGRFSLEEREVYPW